MSAGQQPKRNTLASVFWDSYNHCMGTPCNITDAEWLVMRALWETGSATTSVITERVRLEREVSPQTVKTLLRRLIDKHLVGYAIDPNDSRVYHYRPLVRKDEAIRQKSETFVSQVHQSNVGDFLAHFVENGGLSEDELLRLQRLVKKKLNAK